MPGRPSRVLASHADEDAIIGAITAGAARYIHTTNPPEVLIGAIYSVAAGHSAFDATATRFVMESMRRVSALRRHRNGISPNAAIQASALSHQEQRILPLIAEGKTNREIGATLYLSEHTVKTYVSQLRKLQLTRRVEAAAYVARRQAARAR